MLPLVEPAVLFGPVAQGLVWLGAIAAAGMVVVVGLVFMSSRGVRRTRAAVAPLPRPLREAA
jgi:hypothetical protein